MKEYANKIKTAASSTLAKLERQRELNLRYYQDIQPLIVQAHTIASEGHNQINLKNLKKAREVLYEGSVNARASSTQRILDEQIEIAYKDLYGYDPGIQSIFVSTMERMKHIDRLCYRSYLKISQNDIFLSRVTSEAERLGNTLRDTANMIVIEEDCLMEDAVNRFRKKIYNLITADYKEVYKGMTISNHSSDSITSKCIVIEGTTHDREEIKKIENLMKKWLNQMNENNYKKEAELLKEAVNKVTKSPIDILRYVSTEFLWILISSEYFELQNHRHNFVKMAQEGYEELLKLDPKQEVVRAEDALLWARMAFDLRVSAEDYDLALICYDLAIKIDQTRAGTWAGKALLHKEMAYKAKWKIKNLMENSPSEANTALNNKVKEDNEVAKICVKRARRIYDRNGWLESG